MGRCYSRRFSLSLFLLVGGVEPSPAVNLLPHACVRVFRKVRTWSLIGGVRCRRCMSTHTHTHSCTWSVSACPRPRLFHSQVIPAAMDSGTLCWLVFLSVPPAALHSGTKYKEKKKRSQMRRPPEEQSDSKTNDGAQFVLHGCCSFCSPSFLSLSLVTGCVCLCVC